jgi:hypothetical protein
MHHPLSRARSSTLTDRQPNLRHLGTCAMSRASWAIQFIHGVQDVRFDREESSHRSLSLV